MRHNLIQFDPFQDLIKGWDGDLSGGDFLPPVDIYQKGDNVIVKMETPEIDEDKLDVSVENDVLTVTGSRKDEKEVKREDYYRKEIRSGSFSRSIILPMKVKGNEAEAEFKKGMLKITLPKADEVKPKKITVKVGK